MPDDELDAQVRALEAERVRPRPTHASYGVGDPGSALAAADRLIRTDERARVAARMRQWATQLPISADAAALRWAADRLDEGSFS